MMSDTENLILSVESRPCIWDTSIQEYHDREKKDIAWLEMYKILIPNWETISEDERKIKSLELKRKWSNCRDYYKKEKQKLKNIPTGTAAKKRKQYVHADILGFLDKVVTRRNHEGKYEADDNDELTVTDAKDGHDEQRDVRPRQALEDIKTENLLKNNTNEESKPKKKKTQDILAQILNILKTKQNADTENYDDDEKYLLSFSGDMKKMTHLQKIDFKLGMRLKNIFKENANCNTKNASSYHINLSTRPQSSYTLNYQGVSRSSLAQSRYTGTPSKAPQTIITIPRSSIRPHAVVYNTNPTPQVDIKSVKTISSGGQSAHGDYYEYNQPTGSTSQTEEIATNDEECKTPLNNSLTFTK